MLAWLVLVFLIAAEVAALVWWLRREYYPVMFNSWAVLIYTSVLAADIAVAWLVSYLLVPGGSEVLRWLALLAALIVVIVALLTAFFRWIVRQNLTDV